MLHWAMNGTVTSSKFLLYISFPGRVPVPTADHTSGHQQEMAAQSIMFVPSTVTSALVFFLCLACLSVKHYLVSGGSLLGKVHVAAVYIGQRSTGGRSFNGTNANFYPVSQTSFIRRKFLRDKSCSPGGRSAVSGRKRRRKQEL